MKPRFGNSGDEGVTSQLSDNDYDFLHQLRNTIILLGGKIEIANLMAKSQDYRITVADVEELKRYNMTLIEHAKSKLDNISKMTIRTTSAI